jgi:hypothetical protein
MSHHPTLRVFNLAIILALALAANKLPEERTAAHKEKQALDGSARGILRARDMRVTVLCLCESYITRC